MCTWRDKKKRRDYMGTETYPPWESHGWVPQLWDLDNEQMSSFDRFKDSGTSTLHREKPLVKSIHLLYPRQGSKRKLTWTAWTPLAYCNHCAHHNMQKPALVNLAFGIPLGYQVGCHRWGKRALWGIEQAQTRPCIWKQQDCHYWFLLN